MYIIVEIADETSIKGRERISKGLERKIKENILTSEICAQRVQSWAHAAGRHLIRQAMKRKPTSFSP